jgi:hypothetical protein
MTSPVLNTRLTPLPASISQDPDSVTRYCRRGAGWRSRNRPAGAERNTAPVAARMSVLNIGWLPANLSSISSKCDFWSLPL